MYKRGQFYLVAVMVIVVLFVGFITITNFVKVKHNEPFFNLEDEIRFERQKMLDYVFYNGLSDTQINTTFFNFSDTYISEIGSKINSLFIFGDVDEIYFNGNSVGNVDFGYNCGVSYVNITSVGNFVNNCDPDTNNVTLYLDGQDYFFYIYEGQNFYYLINYLYEEERFTIYG